MTHLAISTPSASTPAAREQRASVTLTSAEAFEALVAEHNLTVEEWDTTTLDNDLRDKFYAIYIEKRGRKILAVPIGQDPTHRLAALRAVLAHQGVAA